ncbi:MAG: hypothetical protein PVH50_12960 [Anaerolineae bacterium]|jgi:hypothetical protein
MTGHSWWTHLIWVFAAGVVGFAITAVFAGWLELRREWVVLAYLAIAGAFLYGYAVWSQIDLIQAVRRRWLLGLAGAAIVGFIAARKVSLQPTSPRSHGAQFAFDLLWCGVVYGALDGIFLSVMPLLATREAFSELGWLGGWAGAVGAGLVGLLASTYVTTAYHWGYPEFRGTEVGMPILGNNLMSLGMILTRNPLTATVSHVAMHVAAVIHGMEATIQLPPHY